MAEALEAGRHAILKIDVQGAEVVRARVPDALLIFVAPPTIDALARAADVAGDRDDDQLVVRQRNAAEEMARQKDYDYVVVNETGEVDGRPSRSAQIIDLEAARHAERRVQL